MTVSLPNGIRVPITHTGTIHLSEKLILHHVLHVLDFQFNLISISGLVNILFCSAHFFSDGCFIQDLSQDSMIGRGNLYHNLYIMETSTLSTSSPATFFTGSVHVSGNLWHQRLGHHSLVALNRLGHLIPSLKAGQSDFTPCTVCPLAKQKRLAFVSHNNLSSLPFDLIHIYIWGPFRIESVEGFKYFLTIVDDCTRVTWVYMLKNKSDVVTIFPTFLKLVSTQYNAKIKAIRSDNTPELAFPDLIKDNGILYQFSCAYTPQQNSVVGRKHQHLLNVARALLFQSNVPLAYWSDCILTSVFLINRIPSHLLDNASPFEKLFGKLPDYTLLKSFGCLCYVSTYQEDCHKFFPVLNLAFFLDIQLVSKDTKFWTLSLVQF